MRGRPLTVEDMERMVGGRRRKPPKGGREGGVPLDSPPPIIRKLLKEKMQYVLLYNKKVVVPVHVVWHCRCRAFEAFTSILIANDKLKITRDILS